MNQILALLIPLCVDMSLTKSQTKPNLQFYFDEESLPKVIKSEPSSRYLLGLHSVYIFFWRVQIRTFVNVNPRIDNSYYDAFLLILKLIYRMKFPSFQRRTFSLP